MSINFDPIEQIDATLSEFDRAMIEARACVDRAERLRAKVAGELAAIREERDRLEVMTEPEAAAVLKITPDQLGDIRRRTPGFPHINFGNRVRYTAGHLAAIVAMFEEKSSPAKRHGLKAA